MFCGAGGSSLGLEFVCCPDCGRQLIKVTQAVNHWDLAVEAHNANFPDADHDVHDVEDIPASRFRRTPIFWASPECVNHTKCKGKRDDSPEAMRSRATFKDIVRFTHHHRYDAIIVENVVEARLWCEHENCACGAEFDAWYQAIIDEGYDGQIVYFNSQFAIPTPQSRDRMYVVFWRRGLRRPELNFRPVSWCSSCETIVHGVQSWKKASKGSSREAIFEWGRYGSQYLYRCPNEGCNQPVAPAVTGATTAIDWTLPIQRIGDRKFKNGSQRHLAPNTRKRIRIGLQNQGVLAPVQVQVGGNLYERDGYARVWSVDDPMRTVTTTNYTALVTPPEDDPPPDGWLTRVGGQSQNAIGRSTNEPLQTLLTSDRQIGLIVQNMTNNRPRSTEEPVPPITTGGNAMLVYNGNPGFVRHLGDAIGTITARDKQSLLLPPMPREELIVTEQDIDDCYFRMLQWTELLRGQVMHAHPDGSSYQLTARRRNKRGEFVELSNELKTKMIGNAVSCPVATMLGFAVTMVLV